MRWLIGPTGALLALATLAACSGGDDAPDEAQNPIVHPRDAGTDGGNPNAAGIDAYIKGLDLIQGADPKKVKGNPSAPVITGDISCTTTDLSETRQYDKVVAYAVNSDTLFAGALVHGSTVQNGVLTPVALDRAPLKLSVSLENLAGGKSAEMPVPSLSAYRDAVGQLLAAGMTGATPAQIYSEIEDVSSEQQFQLALGVSYAWGGGLAGSVGASFNFTNKEVQSRKLVRFTQAYYTVDVDPPNQPSAMFANDVTVDQVREKFPEGDPPAYVSSITYGRTVLFTVESKYSSDETGVALQAAFAGIGGQIGTKDAQVLNESKITAFIVGGAGTAAAAAIDSYPALKQYITTGGDYSRLSPGAPIAYKLRYLKDGTPLKTSLTQDYKLTQCDRIGNTLHVSLNRMKVVSSDGDGSLQVYGHVTVTSQGKTTALFDKKESNYVDIRDGAFFPQQGVVGDTKISVTNTPKSSFSVDVDLTDHNDFLSNNRIGRAHRDFPIEDGWHRVVKIPLTDNQLYVELELAIEPL